MNAVTVGLLRKFFQSNYRIYIKFNINVIYYSDRAGHRRHCVITCEKFQKKKKIEIKAYASNVIFCFFFFFYAYGYPRLSAQFSNFRIGCSREQKKKTAASLGTLRDFDNATKRLVSCLTKYPIRWRICNFFPGSVRLLFLFFFFFLLPFPPEEQP